MVALKHDIVRGLKDGQSYLLMESSPNQQNWQPYNKLKKPGEVRLMSFQALAHGADSVQFFQMRQSIGGQEKFHGALISHAGHENTRIFKECSQLGSELKKLGGRRNGGRSHAHVGMFFDWSSWWALENSSGPNQDLQFLEIMTAYYKAFHTLNIPVDVIGKDADFSRYDILVAPMLYMLSESEGVRLQEFVSAG
jgi:beta-galactosidase